MYTFFCVLVKPKFNSSLRRRANCNFHQLGAHKCEHVFLSLRLMLPFCVQNEIRMYREKPEKRGLTHIIYSYSMMHPCNKPIVENHLNAHFFCLCTKITFDACLCMCGQGEWESKGRSEHDHKLTNKRNLIKLLFYCGHIN